MLVTHGPERTRHCIVSSLGFGNRSILNLQWSAVLPFTNMSGDPEQQYFSDGATEDIIAELSRFRERFVIARNSSFRHRDGATDVKRIGRELGADYLVEGSVRRVGGRVRVTVQLIEAVSRNHLWAAYDCFLQGREQLQRFDVDLQHDPFPPAWYGSPHVMLISVRPNRHATRLRLPCGGNRISRCRTWSGRSTRVIRQTWST